MGNHWNCVLDWFSCHEVSLRCVIFREDYIHGVLLVIAYEPFSIQGLGYSSISPSALLNHHYLSGIYARLYTTVVPVSPQTRTLYR
jgi:hypothetical protein